MLSTTTIFIAIVLSLALLSFSPALQTFAQTISIELLNNCDEPIWPAIKAADGQPQIEDGGFGPMAKGEGKTLSVPSDWKSARIWPRTGCGTNINCSTGSCGFGILKCNGLEGVIPASLAEFTLNADQGLSYYDVSYVDGFNVPLEIEPLAGTFDPQVGNCRTVVCSEDQRKLAALPDNMKVKSGGGGGATEIIAVLSLCSAFKSDQTCCKNAFNDGQTCANSWDPTQKGIYQTIKSVCPTSYLYAYDDHSSLFTCKGMGGGGRVTPDFKVTFCGLNAAAAA